jgi:serine/threonine-protein kinase
MDFGLAKLLDPNVFKNVSMSGTDFAIGTPGYMCPEQARGEEMDHRGDLYSVGVILYEMLCGRLPFAGRETMDVMLAHATEPPPLFAVMGAADWVPPAIEAVVRQCLAKWPGERPNSARELAEHYEAALAHAPLTAEPLRAEESIASGDAPAAITIQPSRSDTPVALAEPEAVVHHLEAWMPEKIAAVKLRGFVEDAGGEVLESIPGRIRVRLGGKGSAYAPRQRNSWLGLGRRSAHIDVELLLERADALRESLLHITILMRPHDRRALDDGEWRGRCGRIFCDLRGYLMGQ